MRVAPIALYGAVEGRMTIEQVTQIAGDAAEVTHKHPLGFLSAALFAAFIYKVTPLTPAEVTANSTTLVEECLEVVARVYQGKHRVELDSLKHLTHRAIDLAASDKSDAESILHLGEGWVGDEAWAIALYCVLRHSDSVERAIIAAVNHDGDSDSTGSICGNIMGAIYGYKHIKERNIFCPTGHELEQTLELTEVILKVANELTE
jgi:ADP-ribosylglycohydrolase